MSWFRCHKKKSSQRDSWVYLKCGFMSLTKMWAVNWFFFFFWGQEKKYKIWHLGAFLILYIYMLKWTLWKNKILWLTITSNGGGGYKKKLVSRLTVLFCSKIICSKSILKILLNIDNSFLCLPHPATPYNHTFKKILNYPFNNKSSGYTGMIVPARKFICNAMIS